MAYVERKQPRLRIDPPRLISFAGAEGGEADVREWLRARAVEHGLTWLLAHADDGVIWGRLDDGRLVTSCDAAVGDEEAERICVELRPRTLQQVRLFAPRSEILIWRDGDRGFHERVLLEEGDADGGLDGRLNEAAGESDGDGRDDSPRGWSLSLDEEHILWGTRGRRLKHGFTLMADGAQGLRHVVPLDAEGFFREDRRPLRLVVRHYVRPDETGCERIALSRLVEVKRTPGAGRGDSEERDGLVH